MSGASNLFVLAEQLLVSPDVERKLELTRQAAESLALGTLVIPADGPAPDHIGQVRFPEKPDLVDPRFLPRRGIASLAGRTALLHAVAHIEFTAVQLAWDMLYRFRGLPDRFYFEWLGVAVEEAMHFGMIRSRLERLGGGYGDLPAHAGLWQVAIDTAGDVAARLALVPRCMEARGLDVTPGMIGRLERVGDEESAAILRRVLADEVGHVALGSHWFRWICRERGADPDTEYLSLVAQHLRGEQRGPYNLSLRREAGFSETELAGLTGRNG